MKIDDKIIDTRKFLMENETQLQNEISELVDDMNNANDLSRKKFDRQREEANYEFALPFTHRRCLFMRLY